MSTQGTSRGLLILALALLITGFAASGIYWSTTDKPAFLSEQENYGDVIAGANRLESGDALALMNAQWETVNESARLVEAHGHFLFLCILILLFSILMTGTMLLPRSGQYLIWLAAGGVVIYPAGLMIQGIGHVYPGQILAAGGALMVLVFTGIVTLGLWRHPSNENSR